MNIVKDTSIVRLIFILAATVVGIIVLIAVGRAKNENELRDTLRWMSDSVVGNSPYDSMPRY